MVYTIKNHILHKDGRPVAQRPTPNRGGVIAPTLLVMHYTAAQNAAGAISWLTDRRAKASAHLVLDQAGAATQLAPFNVSTWHAGVSAWKGRKGCNGFSIGIEMANPGWLTRRADGKFYDASGKVVPASQVVMAAHKNGGPVQPWMVYPKAQIDAAVEIADAIVDAYGIKDIAGHDDIAKGRKSDPGPAWDMASFIARVHGRK